MRKLTNLLVFILFLANIIKAADLEKLIVYHTLNGSNEMAYAYGPGTLNISRDEGTDIDVRIWKSSSAPNPSYFAVSPTPSPGPQDKYSSDSYVTFSNVANYLTSKLQCFVNNSQVVINIETIEETFPNLIPWECDIDPSSNLYVGDEIDMDCSVHNIGDIDADESKLKFYISKTRDYAEDYISSDNVSLLHKGEMRSYSDPYTLTDNDIGTRYIVFVVDADDDVDEGSGEDDNILSYGPFTVQPKPLDITVTQPSSDQSVTQGDEVYIAWDGEGSSNATVSIYYDNDTNWGNGKNLITYNKPKSGNYTLNTSGINTGSYYIACMIDDGNDDDYDYASGRITISQPNGSIALQVYNVDGNSTPYPSDNAKGILQGNSQNVTKESDTNGLLTFPDVPYANGYYVDVYHETSLIPSAVGSQEYWGQKIGINVDGNEDLDFTRDMPYNTASTDNIIVYNDNNQVVTQGEVPIGTPLRIEFKVTDINSIPTKVRMILDQSKGDDDDYDYNVLSSEISTSGTENIKLFSFDYTPQSLGDFYYAYSVEAKLFSEFLPTDRNGWSSFSLFSAIEQEIGTVQLTSPIGGEVFTAGLSMDIDWIYSGNITSLEFQYTIDNGNNWTHIGYPNIDNSPYVWSVPSEINSSECKVKIIGYYNGEQTTDLSETFRIQPDDDTPPNIEIWRMYQSGDQKFRVCAKVWDDGVGVDPSTVKFEYLKIPTAVLKDDYGSVVMTEYSNYPDFYEAEATKPGLGTGFDDGQEVVWRIEAKDFNGNIFRYPDDLGGVQLLETNAELAADGWGARIVVHDYEHLDENKTFHYDFSHPPSGAITFIMDGENIKLYNNTAIWYELVGAQPDGLEWENNFFGGLLLPPKSGVIPLSFSDLFGDRGVLINNAINSDNIIINLDRKEARSIIRNVWDMILITLKPKLPTLLSDDWNHIMEQAGNRLNSFNIAKDLIDNNYKDAVGGMLDHLLLDNSKTIIKEEIALRLVFRDNLSYDAALVKSAKLVSGAWEVIKGINNRVQFLIDVFHYPSDDATLYLVKESNLIFEDNSIPGYVGDENINDGIYINENSTFNLSMIVPEGTQQPYFKLYADIIIYSPEGDTVETTKITDYNYNMSGNLDVSFYGLDGFDQEQGTSFNPKINNDHIGLQIKDYSFSTSSQNHNYYSSLNPYFMEVILYHNGLPGINVNPFEPDIEIATRQIPFRLFDRISPNAPLIYNTDIYVSNQDFAFIVDNKNNDPDIHYYDVYRKLEGEASFSKIEQRIDNNGKESILFFEQLDNPCNLVQYKIKAIDISGNESEFSDVIEINSNNYPPNTFSLISPNDVEIDNLQPTLNWNSTTDPDGTNITYDLWCADNAGYTGKSEVTGLTGTSYQFPSPLSNNTTYYWKVKAIDESGQVRWSTETDWHFTTRVVSQNTPPEAEFTVDPESGDINTTFSFDASGSNDAEDTDANLEVRWDFDNDGTWEYNFSTTKTRTYQYATPNTYTAKLEVRDSNDGRDVVTKEVVVNGINNEVPATPQDLTAISGDQQISLNWDDNAENDLEKYFIYRNTENNSTTAIKISEVQKVNSDYNDTGLTNGVQYYYWVKAVDSEGLESGFSDVTSATPSIQNVDLTNNLVSYWPFDGEITDVVRSVSATNNNSVDEVNGKINHCRSFTGSSSCYIETGDNSFYNFLHNGSDFSISVWEYHNSGIEESCTILGNGIGGDLRGFNLRVFGDDVGFFVGRTSPYPVAGLTWENILDPGVEQWNHIVLSYDNSQSENQYTLFVNGILKGTTSRVNPTTTGDTYSTMKFGINKLSGTIQPFNGDLDELGFWTRKLNSNEIIQLYNNGNGKQYPFNNDNIAPSIPQNLSVISGDQQVQLDWDDNSETDLEKYYIYRNTENNTGTATKITEVQKTNSNYTDTGLTNGTEYYYWIKAVDNQGLESGFSDVKSAIPSTSPIQCDEYIPLTYQDITTQDMTTLLSDEGISSLPSGKYLHKVVINAGGGYNTHTDMMMYLVQNPVSGTVKGVSDASESHRTQIGTDNTLANLYQFNALGWVDALSYIGSQPLYMILDSKWGSDIDTYLYFWFGTDQSMTNIGYSLLDSYSDDFGSINIYSYNITDYSEEEGLLKPQNLTAIPGDQQVALDWDDNIESDLEKYFIYRNTENDTTTATKIDEVQKPNSDYLDTGLSNGTQYFYWVKAVSDKDLESDFSEESCTTPVPADCPFSFITTASSGIFQGQATIENIPAESEDWIAAFDESNICCGTSTIIVNQGVGYINLTIYGDDPTTTDVDEGMNSGEVFKLKLWDASKNKIIEYSGEFSNWENSNGTPMSNYNDHTVIYDFSASVFDNITLNIGWNLISFDVIPENSSPSEIFSGLISNDYLVYISGFNQGAKFYDPKGLSFLNTLNNIEPGYGYWVKVNQQCSVEAEGTVIPADFTVDFRSGWNLLGYWLPNNQSPENGFNSIISQGKLTYVSGFDQGAKFYDPNGLSFLNTLTMLKNGFGYWIKVSDNITSFQYPEAPVGGVIAKSTTSETNPYITKTNNFMFVNGKIVVEGIKPAIGDKIEIRTKAGLLVGEMEVLHDEYLMTTAIYGDDYQTEEIDGAFKDEILSFHYNGVKSTSTIKFTGGMDVQEVILKFNSSQIAEVFNLEPNYPNPFNPTTTISFQLQEKLKVIAVIYNIKGKKIKTLINDNIDAGYHNIEWNATDDYGNRVSAGIYFMNLQTNKFSKTQKMVLLK